MTPPSSPSPSGPDDRDDASSDPTGDSNPSGDSDPSGDSNPSGDFDDRAGARRLGDLPADAWLADVWAVGGRVRLDGPMERSSISPIIRNLATALLGLVVTFLLFQAIGGSLMAVWIATKMSAAELQQIGPSMAEQSDFIGRFTREILISNSIGQLVGLGLVSLGLARLHSSDVRGMLRMRPTSWVLLGLGLAGLLALQPGVQWMAEINRQIPLPDAIQQFEQSQLQLIEKVLKSDTGLWFNLVVMALVPGVFEEVAFRGYVQRQLERALGPASGIVLSGLLFGVYHLRLSQVIPLTLLGMFLAYLTWRTGSLIPAVIVHFAHNALAVTAARYVETSASMSAEALQTMSVPVYAVAGGFVFFGGVVYVLHRIALEQKPKPSTPDEERSAFEPRQP